MPLIFISENWFKQWLEAGRVTSRWWTNGPGHWRICVTSPKCIHPSVCVSDDNLTSIFITFFFLGCNILRPRQNGRHFPDDIFKYTSLNENVWISIKISLTFVWKGLINDVPALVQIMAWRWPGDKPSSEPMMVRLLTHICVAPPQWVKHYPVALLGTKPLPNRVIVVWDQSYIFQWLLHKKFIRKGRLPWASIFIQVWSHWGPVTHIWVNGLVIIRGLIVACMVPSHYLN